MNLKSRDRGEVYDRLCILADKLLRRHKACDTCPVAECGLLLRHRYSKSWCCGGCPHLGLTGCTVQALGCKLHLCAAEKNRQTRRDSDRRLWHRLYKLQLIAHHYQVWVARASKEESLKHGDKDFWFVYDNFNGKQRVVTK